MMLKRFKKRINVNFLRIVIKNTIGSENTLMHKAERSSDFFSKFFTLYADGAPWLSGSSVGLLI